MVPEKWSPQWGFEPLSHESSALTTRPRLLAINRFLNNNLGNQLDIGLISDSFIEPHLSSLIQKYF
jgi:hypothetical protein